MQKSHESWKESVFSSFCFYVQCAYQITDGRREAVHFEKIAYRIEKLCYGLNPEHVDFVCFSTLKQNV